MCVCSSSELSNLNEQQQDNALIDLFRSIFDFGKLRHNRQVLLIGHSYGVAVIAEPGNEPKVVGLVYVAAFVRSDANPHARSGAKSSMTPFGVRTRKPSTRGPQFLERDHNSSWMLRVLGELMSPNDLR
jgi:hypothetical protein